MRASVFVRVVIVCFVYFLFVIVWLSVPVHCAINCLERLVSKCVERDVKPYTLIHSPTFSIHHMQILRRTTKTLDENVNEREVGFVHGHLCNQTVHISRQMFCLDLATNAIPSVTVV